MSELSVIIITKNEESNIQRCLDSVSFADEIIIVDSGSTDATLDIAASYTQKIYHADWPGYGIQKGRALSYASKPWVLSIDADEYLTPALTQEIQRVIALGAHDGYDIKRAMVFNERVMRYGQSDKRVLRLVKREKARFTQSIVHEQMLVDGRIGHLKEPMWHYSFNGVSDLIARMNHYSDLSASERAQNGKRTSVSKACIAALWLFLRNYLFKRGFLDGKEGLTLAIYEAENSFYRHLKLVYIQMEKK